MTDPNPEVGRPLEGTAQQSEFDAHMAAIRGIVDSIRDPVDAQLALMALTTYVLEPRLVEQGVDTSGLRKLRTE